MTHREVDVMGVLVGLELGGANVEPRTRALALTLRYRCVAVFRNRRIRFLLSSDGI